MTRDQCNCLFVVLLAAPVVLYIGFKPVIIGVRAIDLMPAPLSDTVYAILTVCPPPRDAALRANDALVLGILMCHWLLFVSLMPFFCLIPVENSPHSKLKIGAVFLSVSAFMLAASIFLFYELWSVDECVFLERVINRMLFGPSNALSYLLGAYTIANIAVLTCLLFLRSALYIALRRDPQLQAHS